jgi:hypothetical protein
MLKIILLAIVFVALAFVLFAIRILLIKDGQFKGTCANNNPYMQKQGVTCGVCGKKAGEACSDDDKKEEKQYAHS